MDELEELLRPAMAPIAINDVAWRRTRGVLRRRRWTRRGGIALALVSCFVAGAFSMRGWSPTLAKPIEIAKHDTRDPETSPKIAVDPLANAPPDRIERLAGAASDEKRSDLYRRAGDGYLLQGNQLAALRCYGKAIRTGGSSALVIREEDTWLMMSLKLSKKKES